MTIDEQLRDLINDILALVKQHGLTLPPITINFAQGGGAKIILGNNSEPR